MCFACSSLSRNFKKLGLFEKQNEVENVWIKKFNALLKLRKKKKKKKLSRQNRKIKYQYEVDEIIGSQSLEFSGASRQCLQH